MLQACIMWPENGIKFKKENVIMKSRSVSIFLALAALILSNLACAFGQPTLGNVRTSQDQDGKQPTSTFGVNDTIYVVGDVSNGALGNVVTSNWYAVNAVGLDPNFLLDTADISVDQDNFNGIIYFYFPPPTDGWPTGTYKVEVLFNSVLVSTVNFTVQ